MRAQHSQNFSELFLWGVRNFICPLSLKERGNPSTLQVDVLNYTIFFKQKESKLRKQADLLDKVGQFFHIGLNNLIE